MIIPILCLSLLQTGAFASQCKNWICARFRRRKILILNCRLRTLSGIETFIYFSAGFAVVVLQSADQLSPPGAAVTLECRMGPGFGMSSYTMLWYRQNSYRAPLEFLTKEYDEGAGRFQAFIDVSKNNFSLQMTGLHPEDSSTYYCAASHSDADGADGCTNISKSSWTQAGRKWSLSLRPEVNKLCIYFMFIYA